MNIISKWQLSYRQRLPLKVKVKMTELRIQSFVEEYGLDGVYISFSGGKDSTVLLDIARRLYPNIKAVFCDTWLEYPQLRQFVKSFDNVDIVKPDMPMKQIIDEYGWCFPSKDVAEAIWYARKGSQWAINKLHGLDKEGNKSEFRQMYVKWLPLYESDIKISPFCCFKQKEEPITVYEKQTGRKPILALLADESARRKESYLRTGCNSFNSARPLSKPMGFWTEQDVLKYAYERDLKLAPPYGEIYEEGQLQGQMNMFDCDKLCTSGESRTGCMFCPVGCHLDEFAKFDRLKTLEPKLYEHCMEELGLEKLLRWIDLHYVSGKSI